jgi:DNA-binding NarL/FixJ family response regulator
MPTTDTQVLMVGGHPVIRGVVRLACETIDAAMGYRELASAAELRALPASKLPDVLVVDLDLPDGDGLEMLGSLRAGGFEGHVLVLSDREDGATVLAAMRLDASGYLTKSEGLRGLTSAIRTVAGGGRVMPEELRRRAVAELKRVADRAREHAEVRAVLTERELEVLQLMAEGHTMQQIGRRLGISPRTVETHVSKLYRKLGVRSRVRAISRAASLGLIDLR